MLSCVHDVIETTAVGDNGGDSLPPRPSRSARSMAKRFLTDESASRRCSAVSCPVATGVRMADSIPVVAASGPISIASESGAWESANSSLFGTIGESGTNETDAGTLADDSW